MSLSQRAVRLQLFIKPHQYR